MVLASVAKAQTLQHPAYLNDNALDDDAVHDRSRLSLTMVDSQRAATGLASQSTSETDEMQDSEMKRPPYTQVSD